MKEYLHSRWVEQQQIVENVEKLIKGPAIQRILKILAIQIDFCTVIAVKLINQYIYVHMLCEYFQKFFDTWKERQRDFGGNLF